MLNYDFEESVGYWIVRASRALERAMNEELRPLGITLRQFQVLAWLAAEGPLCQRDLAERIGVEPPTLAGVLDRMERDGWIERRPHPDDARKKLVMPSPAARPAWDEMAACARRVRARAASALGPRQLRALRSQLAIVEEAVRAKEEIR